MPMRTPPQAASRTEAGRRTALEVTVLHTNAHSTVKAIEQVAGLTRGLGASIRLLVLQVVPYPLPIETPDVSVEFTLEKIAEMLAPLDVEVRLEICVGRDRSAMLASAFPPGSLVAVGCRPRWWPSAERKTGKLLRRLGHQVVWTE